jgi:hypothetical protein
MTKLTRAKDVYFELDGPDVSPETVDTVLLLRLAVQYFHLMTKASEAMRLGVTLRGVKVLDKCVAIQAITNDAKGAAFAAKTVGAWIAGDEEPSRGAETVTEALRYDLRKLPDGFHARARAASWKGELKIRRDDITARPWEQLELRATPLRVGGEDPVVKFRAQSEVADFILRATHTQARVLGGHLYEEIDIEAEVLRDPDGSISAGRVLAVFSLGDESASSAWRTWFERNEGQAWKGIDNVLVELGRDAD